MVALLGVDMVLAIVWAGVGSEVSAVVCSQVLVVMALTSAPPHHIWFFCVFFWQPVGSGGMVDMPGLGVWTRSTGVVIGHIVPTAPTIIPIFMVLYRVGVGWFAVEALCLGLLVHMLIESWRPRPLLLLLGIDSVLVGATVASTISTAASTSGAPISTADLV